jgi:transcription termination factor Rho
MWEIKLEDLKSKTPAELISFAEENGVENASTMREQELIFAVLKQLAPAETDVVGEGTMKRFCSVVAISAIALRLSSSV